jgi:beta-lactamase regulating signal transducer with metallopeptidase domain
MTAAWMVYSVLVASLIALAAAAIDRLLAIWRLPRRHLWSSAMMIAAVVPLVAATSNAPSRLTPPPLERPPGGDGALASPSVAVAPLQVPLIVQVMGALRRADQPAQVLWITTSAIALGAFLGAFIVLRTRRASWKTATVDGHTAWIARDVGPAVVGILRPRIVLPEWALRLGEKDRGFVLRHETEHIRAGDPRLLLVAGLLLVAMPWNVALWWMTRRMRLAMEIDCDARVLRGTNAVHEYGMLLLAVGERRGRTLPLVASLTEQRASLERRILAMTASRPGYPRLVSAALALVACATGIAVAQTPVPKNADLRAAGVAGSVTTTDDIARQTRDRVQKLVSEHYPAVMRGTSSINRITFVLDASDKYVTSAAWTDTAMLNRSTPTPTSVRMILGAGVRGGPGRTAPTAGTRDGGAGDFGDVGFPKIARDAAASTQSVSSSDPKPLSVFVIRLK